MDLVLVRGFAEDWTQAADKSRMPRTPKKTSRKRRIQTKTAAAPVGIVVRRGAHRRYEALTQKTADLPAVVSWDRRALDRRASSQPTQIDKRKSERRRTPPYTWEVADFIVVDRALDRSPRTPRRAAKRKA